MEEIAEMIAYQEKRFDGSGVPNDSRKGEEIPLGARILKAVLDFDMLETAGNSKSSALDQLRQRSGWYDPRVLTALKAVVATEAEYLVRSVNLQELEVNMILAEDVKTVREILLIAKGHEVSRPLLERLTNIAKTSGIQEPIQVLVPLRKGGKADAA